MSQTSRKDVIDVFKTLRGLNFIARANFMCCGSCASAELSSKCDDYAEKGKHKAGYVFWHRQAEEGIRYTINRHHKRACLYLHFSGDDNLKTCTKTNLEVAERIVIEFAKAGFEIEWNGDINKCVGVYIDTLD